MADQIPTRTLGRTGLEVGRLGFGAMEFRGEPRGRATTDGEAGEVLNNVLAAGINYVDTANDYGLSEERIGRSIASRRSEYFLATKCGCPGPSGGEHEWDRENLFRGLNQSLDLLKTKHADRIGSPIKSTTRAPSIGCRRLTVATDGFPSISTTRRADGLPSSVFAVGSA